MLKYSLCGNPFKADIVTTLAKISEYGFDGLEYYKWEALDLKEVARAKERYGVGVIATCTTFFNLVDAGKREDYVTGLKKTIQACIEMGTPSIITQTGRVIDGISREKQRDVMVETLKQCAPLLEKADIVLEIEPLNTLVNHPGHFLAKSDEAAEIIDRVDSSHVKLLFDVYHQQITEGNVTRNATKYTKQISHYHIADNPGRHEPGTGELNFVNILKAIKQTGFEGYVGLECQYLESPDSYLPKFKQAIIDQAENEA